VRSRITYQKLKELQLNATDPRTEDFGSVRRSEDFSSAQASAGSSERPGRCPESGRSGGEGWLKWANSRAENQRSPAKLLIRWFPEDLLDV
jgi:hypothetical protein